MSHELFFFFLILSGLVSGLLAGLLGIGGGVITVPVLYYLLRAVGFPEDRMMQVAISTSLAATFVTSLMSSWAHHQKKAILFPVLKILIPGLAIGCVAGAIGVHYLPSDILRYLFGSMAVLLGAYFFFPTLPSPHFGSEPNKTLSLFGVLIGALSSMLGVGGGVFAVPTLLGYRLSMYHAVATSSASTLATALIGTFTYLVIAWHKPTMPYTFGYIQVPAFLAISLASLCTTRLGVKLARILPTNLIKRVFALALAATGLAMLLR